MPREGWIVKAILRLYQFPLEEELCRKISKKYLSF